LADFGSSFRYSCDEAALAIDDSGKPVRGDVFCTEEAPEVACHHDDGKGAKGLVALKDGNFDNGAPLLRDRADHEVAYHHRARRECAALDREGHRVAAWQVLPRLGERVEDLLAICVRDHHPTVQECPAYLRLNRFEIVAEQYR
jgi:hypothetical protein